MIKQRGKREGSFDYDKARKRWRCRLQDEGHKYYGYGKTRQDAKAGAEAKRGQSAGLEAASAMRLTVAKFAADWTPTKRNGSPARPTTVDQQLSLTRAHIIPAIGGARIDRVTEAHVKKTVAHCAHLSASTQRQVQITLVALLRSAGWPDATNPARLVPRVEPSPPRQDRITDEQARRIIEAAADHPHAGGAVLVLTTGLRRGELLGLTWNDYDETHRELRVESQITQATGGRHRGEPKTKRGIRTIPLEPLAVAALDRLRAARYFGTGSPIIAGDTGDPLHPRTWSRLWERWARQAEGHTGTHTARRWSVTQGVAARVASVADLSAMYGHDPRVLLDVYAAPMESGQRAAATAIEAVLVAEPPDNVVPLARA